MLTPSITTNRLADGFEKMFLVTAKEGLPLLGIDNSWLITPNTSVSLIVLTETGVENSMLGFSIFFKKIRYYQ